MIYRWAAWVVAFAAVCAVQMRLDNTPADPTPAAAPKASKASLRAMLVYSVAAFPPRHRSFCPQSPAPQLPAGLRVYLGAPHLVEGLTQTFEIFARAQARDLHSPVTVQTQFSKHHRAWPGVKEGPISVCIWPAWDTQAAYPVGDDWFSDRLDGQSDWETGEGFALIRNAWMADEGKLEFWASYRRGLAGPEQRPASLEPGVWATRFYPTGLLNALGTADPESDELFAERLDTRNTARGETVEVVVVPGGLAVLGTAERHATLTERLENPQFIRLARALQSGSPERRAAARRAAFSDDDPWLISFAVAQLCSHPQAASEFPFLDLPQLFEAAGRCDPGALASWDSLVSRLLAWLPEAEWRRIATLVQGSRSIPPARPAPPASEDALAAEPVDHQGFFPDGDAPPAGEDAQAFAGDPVDPCAVLCGLALTHPRAEVRRTAEAAILSHFPPRALSEVIRVPQTLYCGLSGRAEKVTLKPEAANWSAAEREAFFQRLVVGVREQLDHEDAVRALDALRDALVLCEMEVLPETSSARSRMYELAADLLLDPRHRAAFGRAGDATTARAAEELLRRSDPDARRLGCTLISRVLPWSTTTALEPLAGDPFTADILGTADFLAPTAYPTSGGGGFF